MTYSILLYTYYVLLFIFGYIFALLLVSAKSVKTSYWWELSFAAADALLLVVIACSFSIDHVRILLPLITHLPLAAFLSVRYHKSVAASITAVTSSYMCCLIPRWFSSLISVFTVNQTIIMIINIVSLLIVASLLIRFIAEPISKFLSGDRKTVIVIGLVPITFYIFNYATTVYTDILYTSAPAVVEFPMFFISIAFLASTVLFLREYYHRLDLEKQQQYLSIQLNSYEAIKKRINETRKANHDLRQHLRLIQGYLDTGDTNSLKDYINKYAVTLPHDLGIRYCENHIANTIIKFYAEQAEATGISFQSDAIFPESINISEPDICVLLGNLLENAVESCREHLDDAPAIHLIIKLVGASTLVITIDNAPAKKPSFLDGALVSTKHLGSGIGTVSAKEIASKYNGTARFEWKDGSFMTSVILQAPPVEMRN